VFDYPVTPATRLEGAPQVAALVAAIPAASTVKGLFFKRFADILGADYATLAGELENPQREANYVAFKGYSQRDYTRLAVATARKRFPSLSLREGVRRLAREDIATFASSVVGKVVLAMARDARSTLHRMPNAYAGMAPDTRIHVVDLDPRTARVVFEPHQGIVEYTLGQVEGIVLAFEHDPVVTLRDLGKGGVAFDVVHGSAQ
jgi:uncharacterized protein (TIGR02265 family)